MISREYRALEALRRCVRSARSVRVDLDGSIIQLQVGGHTTRHRLVWIGEGFPQDVERSLARLGEYDDSIPLLLAASRMSRRARELMERREINWVDEAGRVHIEDGRGLVLLTGPKADEGAAPSPKTAFKWSQSAAAVAEVLLSESMEHSGRFHASVPRADALAQATGYSYPQIARVLQSFDGEGYTEKAGSERGASARRTLADRSALLSSWARWYSTRSLPHVTFTGIDRDPEAYTEIVSEAFGTDSIQVSGWLAAEAYAPVMTTVPSATVYVEGMLPEHVRVILTERYDLRPVQSGWRLDVVTADAWLRPLSQSRGGRTIVSPIRAYGDLLRFRSRGEDAASQLREDIIGF